MNALELCDIAILGSGPAGMQAALVTSRTGKKVIVFDDPEPPRNAASHGVHNFMGLEGLLPAEIRDVAWKQISSYQNAELRQERVTDLQRRNGGEFIVIGAGGSRVEAGKVILAVGYHDVYPTIPGFRDCWGRTIIPCPFCDGYENRDRVWGIVPNSTQELEKFPIMALNWTSGIKVFLSPGLNMSGSLQEKLTDLRIPVHVGAITEVHHSHGKVEAVTLDSGERIKAGTLLWIPPEKPSPLIQSLVKDLGLVLDESGYVKTDEMQRTNIEGLWVAGDVQGWSGALEAAAAGGRAAVAIIKSWYD